MSQIVDLGVWLIAVSKSCLGFGTQVKCYWVGLFMQMLGLSKFRFPSSKLAEFGVDRKSVV